MADRKLNVVVWDENPSHAPKELYPESLRGAIAEGLRKFDTKGELSVSVACLDDPEQGITDALLAKTDVLLWWGHARHGEVKDSVAERVKERCHKGGMGLIVLHSGHYS